MHQNRPVRSLTGIRMQVRPFTIHVADEAVESLRARLRNIHWPSTFDEVGWADGASLSFMRRLAEYWRDRFDWRVQERRLNRLPQYVASIDGREVHFVHQRGVGTNAIPLVLTHGW